MAFDTYQALYHLLEELGMWESYRKRTPPDVVMTFLGISADTVKMLLTLTPERLEEIRKELELWRHRDAANKRDLQSLVGKLNFAASTVRSGRLFFSRILSFMNMLPKHGVRRFDADVRKDIDWWLKFMAEYDGVSIIHELEWKPVDLVMSSDACKDGIGGFCAGEYYHCKVPQHILDMQDVHINELECLALLICLKIWGSRCGGLNILMHCDNTSTVEVVNAGKGRNKFTQSCLREIAFLAGKHSFQVKVEYTPGMDNRLADRLSRWHLDPVFAEEFFAEVSSQFQPEAIKQVLVSSALIRFDHDW